MCLTQRSHAAHNPNPICAGDFFESEVDKIVILDV